MKRREFITLLGSAAAWPLAARAQQGDRAKIIRIGFIGASLNSPAMATQYQAFLTELRELGFKEDQNIRALTGTSRTAASVLRSRM